MNCENKACEKLLLAAKNILLEYFGKGTECPTRGTLELRNAIAECEGEPILYVSECDY